MLWLSLYQNGMEPIAFQSQHGNYYLYSPSMKALMPLPKDAYEMISEGRHGDDDTVRQLRKHGYLDDFSASLDACITGDAVRHAMATLSQIIFETTTLCNLRCEYCCYSDGYGTFDSRRGITGHLKFETAKSIIDNLTELFRRETKSDAPKEPFAISFYGGEPLMNFDVVRQIVEYAEETEWMNRSLYFTMTTNAMLLSRHADFLSRHNFKMLISLDGDKDNDYYRKTAAGASSFDTVMNNLRDVERLYPEWFATFSYNTVYTNRSDVRQIVEWFKEQLGTTPNFSPLHTPTEDAVDKDKISSMLKDFVIPEDIAMNPGLITQNPLFNRILTLCTRLLGNSFNKESDMLTDDGNDSSILPTGTCIPFSKRMFVSYDGKMHPCEKVNRDRPLGHIDGQGSVHIDCDDVADQFMERIRENKSLCARCYLQACCTKCSFCYSNGKCDEFASKSKFAKLLAEAVSYIEMHPDIIDTLENKIIIK